MMILSNKDEVMKEIFEILSDNLDNVAYSYVLIDLNGKILKTSERVIDFYGVSAKDSIGQSINDIVKHSSLMRVIETGKSEVNREEIFGYKKCVVNRTPLFVDGEKVGALGIIYAEENPSISDRVWTTVGRNERNRKIVGLGSPYSFEDFISENPASKKTIEIAKKVSKSKYPILIVGDTGTGKEIIANAIHSGNPNTANKPFVKINCTAIPNELLESELFGYEKGEFTGASSSKQGKFELAGGGSILLDEIGDMDIRLQGKLLRVLEERTFERVGGNKPLIMKARIIASTNVNLIEKCKEGKFRADLYYRLNTVELRILPLKQRREDIPLLVEHFMKYNLMKGKISKDAMKALKLYDWPGNVRELRNEINRLDALYGNEDINVDDLNYHIYENYIEYRNGISQERCDSCENESWNGRLKIRNREVLVKALEKHEYNITRTAEELGVTRVTVYKHMKKEGINNRALRRT